MWEDRRDWDIGFGVSGFGALGIWVYWLVGIGLWVEGSLLGALA